MIDRRGNQLGDSEVLVCLHAGTIQNMDGINFIFWLLSEQLNNLLVAVK